MGWFVGIHDAKMMYSIAACSVVNGRSSPSDYLQTQRNKQLVRVETKYEMKIQNTRA